MTAGRAIRTLGCLALMLLWIAGCGGAPAVKPQDKEPAQENFTPSLPATQPTPAPQPEYFSHIVRGPGETFMAIARWYTGTADHWKRISEANPGIEPRYIRIGTAIRIPEKLLITRKPMPRPAPPVRAIPPKPKPKTSPTPAAPVDVELYGPIETSATPAEQAPAEVTPELEPLE